MKLKSFVILLCLILVVSSVALAVVNYDPANCENGHTYDSPSYVYEQDFDLVRVNACPYATGGHDHAITKSCEYYVYTCIYCGHQVSTTPTYDQIVYCTAAFIQID